MLNRILKPPEGGFFVDQSATTRDRNLLRKNFWLHLIEGSLYLSTSVLLSPQTVFPALVIKLGGNNVAVGAIPIIVYLMYYFPQILSANYIRSTEYRKFWTLRLGILQRVQIFLFAVSLLLLGVRWPAVALLFFFLVYVANQVFAGLGSPVWYDLVAKTTVPADRGKLMGIRISVGAVLGLLNGFLLTLFLAYLPFPENFAAVFGLAFLLQFASWLTLRHVTETQQSNAVPRDSLTDLLMRVRKILTTDAVYRRFLVSAAFLVVGLMPTGFFMIAALKQYGLDESYVGVFTMTLVGAQVLSGAVLGWIADRKGHKVSLLLCAASTAAATAAALISGSLTFYFIVFFFVGVNLGAEGITRYNFVERCSTESDRPMYVGIMNAWIAPFYFSATLGGWVVDHFGFLPVFVLGLCASTIGIFLLARIPDPSRRPGISVS